MSTFQITTPTAASKFRKTIVFQNAIRVIELYNSMIPTRPTSQDEWGKPAKDWFVSEIVQDDEYTVLKVSYVRFRSEKEKSQGKKDLLISDVLHVAVSQDSDPVWEFWYQVHDHPVHALHGGEKQAIFELANDLKTNLMYSAPPSGYKMYVDKVD